MTYNHLGSGFYFNPDVTCLSSAAWGDSVNVAIGRVDGYVEVRDVAFGAGVGS